jgi:hypothetical protein
MSKPRLSFYDLLWLLAMAALVSLFVLSVWGSAYAQEPATNFPASPIGDGKTDNTLTLQWLVEQAGQSGAMELPAGRFAFSEPLELTASVVRVSGQGDNRSVLVYTGKGSPIQVRAPRQVILENFGLECQSADATDGITIGAPGKITGWQYELRNLRVKGFANPIYEFGRYAAAYRYKNIEQTETSGCWAVECGIGFYADNTAHANGALGVSNHWLRNRAEHCKSYGWILDSQSACIVTACQSLQNEGPAQFWVRRNCDYLTLLGLDVEATGKSIGLLISGEGHEVKVNAWNLAQAIQGEGVSNTQFHKSRFRPKGMPGLKLDKASINNKVE